MATIISRDNLRSSVEAATGGLCSVIYDSLGYPNYMRRIPKTRIEKLFPDLGVTGTHPAFIVNGVEKEEIWIGMFPASIAGDAGVSLPGLPPATGVDFDQALAYCKAKGDGWHLMTNAEWALMQAIALASSFSPHGNNDYGSFGGAPYETGCLVPGENQGKTLGGSGPITWRHDNSPCGIADLVGNVWEWVGGLRLNHGEINIIENNNAADNSLDQAANSALWKSILQNGEYSAPFSLTSMKLDSDTSGGEGAPIYGTAVENPLPSTSQSFCAGSFNAIKVKSGVEIPAMLKILGLYPAGNVEGYIWLRNYGICMATRGGSFSDTRNGIFSLDFRNQREQVSPEIGFRVAYVV